MIVLHDSIYSYLLIIMTSNPSFDNLVEYALTGSMNGNKRGYRGGGVSKKNFYYPENDPSSEIPADFRDIPFWCGDSTFGIELHTSPRACCFNHLVGLPKKKNKDDVTIRHPIYDYEEDIIKNLETNQHLWVKKSRGIGFTTLMRRYFAWICTRDDYLQGQKIFILTGTQEKFANVIKEEIEEVFKEFHPNLIFKSIFSELYIIKVMIKIFPTKALKDMRGYTDVAYIFIDEADFFEVKQQEEIGAVIRSYEEKSNAKIIMVSTPYKPDGLFSEIEHGTKYQGFFKQMQLGYWVGLGKIYDPEVIERIKKNNRDFDSEYALKYVGHVGNIFTEPDIDLTLQNGALLLQQNPELTINQARLHFVGLDQPGGGASPAVVVAVEVDQLSQKVNIMRVKSWGRGSINSKIADELFNLYVELGYNTRFYADGAKPEFINEVKTRFGERTDWEKSEDVTIFDNIIIPVNFNHTHFHMLRWLHQMINEGYLALPLPEDNQEEFDKVLTSLRTCTAEEWKLDKKETVYDSHLDALRLALKGVEWPGE